MRRITLASDFDWAMKQFQAEYATREELAEQLGIGREDLTGYMAMLPGNRMIEVYQGSSMTYAVEREAVPELKLLIRETMGAA